VTLIPATIFVYRAQLGAADPTDVFIPLLVATFCSTMVGLICTALVQKLKLADPVVLAYLGGLTALVAGLVLYFARLDRATMERQSSLLSNFLIFSVVIGFLALAAWKRAPLYETFVDGAKDGFQVAIGIIPYLVAMLVAIGVLRASGALDLFLDGVRWAVAGLGVDTRWVDGLPTALMRPLSGSGARGLLIETMESHGADSFAGRLASVIQGSTETTFYVLAVYFGSVGIRRTRHAVACGLAADAAGIVAAILVCYLFFG
jgi:spore maturation protein SpmB